MIQTEGAFFDPDLKIQQHTISIYCIDLLRNATTKIQTAAYRGSLMFQR
jgi:hypothetical protein